MSPSLLNVLLHIGRVIAVAKDAEVFVAELLKGNNVSDEGKQLVMDFLGLLDAGIIPVPGLSKEDVSHIVAEINATVVLEPKA